MPSKLKSVCKSIWQKDWTTAWACTKAGIGSLLSILFIVDQFVEVDTVKQMLLSLGNPWIGPALIILGAITFVAKSRA